MLNLYHRIAKHDHSMNGSLSFANEWDFLTQDPARHYENLVSTGPYAGTLEAFATGVKLRTRYIDLLEAALARGKVSFWASGSDRVEETARYFGAGFFGLDWERHARLQVIPETSDLGADTLTPGDTCLDYANDVNDFGHAYGARMLSEFRGTYIPAIASRLAEENASLKFSEDEVYAMQEICGFETLAKGSSPWCDVFTHDEWESFEYARDVLHYYRAGPGNPYGATMGWLYLNATANLLRSGPEAGELFLSLYTPPFPTPNPSDRQTDTPSPSVHDGDITPFLTALSLLPQTPHLPTTQPLRNRTWRTSDVVPMGGRVLLERLACPAPVACWDNAPFYPNHVYCESPRDELSVRVNVNDGVVAIPGCDGGAGGSCPLEEFLERVERRGREVGDFGEQVGDFGAVCGLGEDAPDGITFLHQ